MYIQEGGFGTAGGAEALQQDGSSILRNMDDKC